MRQPRGGGAGGAWLRLAKARRDSRCGSRTAARDVIGAAIIRQPKAYPVYDGEYRAALDVLEEWILGLENFQTVGRNGLHRYNNQDHSMLSAMYAARNVLGEKNDVWNVNVERSYHEEFEVKKPAGTVKPALAAE